MPELLPGDTSSHCRAWARALLPSVLARGDGPRLMQLAATSAPEFDPRADWQPEAALDANIFGGYGEEARPTQDYGGVAAPLVRGAFDDVLAHALTLACSRRPGDARRGAATLRRAAKAGDVNENERKR